jgi:hypothetical protein
MADALENACIDGHPQIVEYLLSKNAADCFDDDIYVCFHEFVMRTWAADYDSVSESNKTAILMMLMHSGCAMRSSSTARAAGAGGTIAYLEYLLQHLTVKPIKRLENMYDEYDEDEGDDSEDGEDGEGKHRMAPALYAACEHARMDIIRFLYPVVTRKRRVISPPKLLKAAALGGREAFELVLGLLKIDVNNVGTCYDRDDVLLQAVRSGSVGAVTALLGHPGCDINKVYDVSITFNDYRRDIVPGTLLAAASDPATIAVLLKHRADVNPRGCVSVLATAVRRFRPAAVEALLAAGAGVASDIQPESAKYLRIKTLQDIFFHSSRELDEKRILRDDQRVPVLNMLLGAGMQTQRLHLNSFKSLPLVRVLGTHNPCMLAVPDHQGNTPLEHAVLSDDLDRTKLLLELGADPTACSRGSMTMVLLLWEWFILYGDRFWHFNDDELSEMIACLCDAIVSLNSTSGAGGMSAGAVSKGSSGDAGQGEPRKRQRRE